MADLVCVRLGPSPLLSVLPPAWDGQPLCFRAVARGVCHRIWFLCQVPYYFASIAAIYPTTASENPLMCVQSPYPTPFLSVATFRI
jgi:hypothetical protein